MRTITLDVPGGLRMRCLLPLQCGEDPYLSAIINGVLAPFLLAGIQAVASDRQIMESQPSPLVARLTVLVVIVAMVVAGAAMIFG